MKYLTLIIITFSIAFSENSEIYIGDRVYSLNVNKIEFNTLFTDSDTTISLRVIDSIKTNNKNILNWLTDQQITNIRTFERSDTYIINLTEAEIPYRVVPEFHLQKFYSLQGYISHA